MSVVAEAAVAVALCLQYAFVADLSGSSIDAGFKPVGLGNAVLVKVAFMLRELDTAIVKGLASDRGAARSRRNRMMACILTLRLRFSSSIISITLNDGYFRKLRRVPKICMRSQLLDERNPELKYETRLVE